MKVIGYIRVSGKSQLAGDGPERQQKAILDFCYNQGLDLLDIFTEDISGTTDGINRPIFTRIVHERPEGCGLVVERLDRLARDLMVQEALLAECRKRKLPVYAADHGDRLDLADLNADPSRKALRQMMGVFSEFEKSSLIFKLRAAKQRAKVERGMIEGRKPFGFHPWERQVMEDLLKRFAKTGGYADTAHYLNCCGYVTRTGVKWDRRHVFSLIGSGKYERTLDKYRSELEAAKQREAAEAAGDGDEDGEESGRDLVSAGESSSKAPGLQFRPGDAGGWFLK